MQWIHHRRGGEILEGVVAGCVAMLLILGILDIGIAYTLTVNIDNATARAGQVMQATHDTNSAIQAGQTAMVPFATSCLSMQAWSWPKISGTNIGQLQTGTPFVGTAPAGTEMVALRASCTWGWLTPVMRIIAGPSVTFTRVTGVPLE